MSIDRMDGIIWQQPTLPPPLIDMLPDDTLYSIFETLNLASLGRCAQVRRSWNHLIASDQSFQARRAIYVEVAFSPHKWKQFFPEFKIGPEEHEKAFNALTDKMVQILKSPSELFFSKELVKDTDMLLWIPDGLTLNKIGELAKQYFPDCKDGFSNIEPKITNKLGNERIESGWSLITKRILPGSGDMIWSRQVEMLERRVPVSGPQYTPVRVSDAAMCALCQFATQKTKLFRDRFTRCDEAFTGPSGGPTFVGFTDRGIHLSFDNLVTDCGGIAAVRRFPQ